MPGSRPLAPDLLAVVQDYLETQVAPQLPPLHRFQLKIVARVLATVSRELEQGGKADAAELARLRALLGREGSAGELNAALAHAIRTGDLAVDDVALLAHLRSTVEDALRINNPKWLAAGS